jgi:YD repeat-containing protein
VFLGNTRRIAERHTGTLTQPGGTTLEQKKTSHAWTYDYPAPGQAQPHAPRRIGERSYQHDPSGNQLGWTHDANGTRRELQWDDLHRLQLLSDNGHTHSYAYDHAGKRVIKRGPQGETVYVNPWFTLRNQQIGTKHVWAGSTRLVSKLMKQDKPGANPNGKTPLEKDLYHFHPDHLGSSNHITDSQGQLYQHLQYTSASTPACLRMARSVPSGMSPGWLGMVV